MFAASENARKTTKSKLNIKYGPLDGQQLDMFFPADYQESKKGLELSPQYLAMHS